MKRLAVLPVLILLGLISQGAFAHPVDECVQAAYLKLGLNSLELELDLTPGERVAPQVLKLIDQNRDGLMDQSEVQAYAERVIRDLRLNVDDQPQTLALGPVVAPDTLAFLAGGGTIKINARTNLADVAGPHTFEFHNAHTPVKSGYLANVFVQSGEVKILEQQRGATQQDFRVRYSFEPQAPRFDRVWLIPAMLAVTALIAWWLMRTKRRSDAIPQP